MFSDSSYKSLAIGTYQSISVFLILLLASNLHLAADDEGCDEDSKTLTNEPSYCQKDFRVCDDQLKNSVTHSINYDVNNKNNPTSIVIVYTTGGASSISWENRECSPGSYYESRCLPVNGSKFGSGSGSIKKLRTSPCSAQYVRDNCENKTVDEEAVVPDSEVNHINQRYGTSFPNGITVTYQREVCGEKTYVPGAPGSSVLDCPGEKKVADESCFSGS